MVKAHNVKKLLINMVLCTSVLVTYYVQKFSLEVNTGKFVMILSFYHIAGI